MNDELEKRSKKAINERKKTVNPKKGFQPVFFHFNSGFFSPSSRLSPRHLLL